MKLSRSNGNGNSKIGVKSDGNDPLKLVEVHAEIITKNEKPSTFLLKDDGMRTIFSSNWVVTLKKNHARRNATGNLMN